MNDSNQSSSLNYSENSVFSNCFDFNNSIDSNRDNDVVSIKTIEIADNTIILYNDYIT